MVSKYEHFHKLQGSRNTLRLLTKHISRTFLSAALTRTANELDPAEDVDPAGQEHSEALDLHAALLACVGRGLVPLVEVPALGLVVDVVEQAMFRNQECVALESSSFLEYVN